MEQTICIIRGASTTGRKHLSELLAPSFGANTRVYTHTDFVSADTLAKLNSGEALTDEHKAQLIESHRLCLSAVEASLREGLSVVIHNPFPRIRHLYPYLRLAKGIGCKPYVLESLLQPEEPGNYKEKLLQSWATTNPKDLALAYLTL